MAVKDGMFVPGVVMQYVSDCTSLFMLFTVLHFGL